MHPIKNLPTLLRAWARVHPEGWRLKLVGSSEVGHRAELEALARELGISEQVGIQEPVYGAEKDCLLRDAQLFCLVSKSENFGIAAAEGLAAGLPVIASKETPWSCLETEKLGWWVPGNVDSLAEALQEATAKTPEQLKALGEKARAYAHATFGWSKIAFEFVQRYTGLISEIEAAKVAK